MDIFIVGNEYKCKRGYTIKALKSAAGWYVGTLDESGFPQCRLSSCYAKTKEEAEKLPLDRGYACEIKFCNGGTGCFERS